MSGMSGPRRFILIDGPSGSGKTTYAGKLGERTGLAVIHLDDFYPGWGGLKAGSEMVARDVLDPVRPGFRRWDWVNDEPGEWVDLAADHSSIIEGVGAVTPENIAAARRLGEVCTIRVVADADERKRRALRRDPDFAPWWDMWAAQERRLFADSGEIAVDRTVRH